PISCAALAAAALVAPALAQDVVGNEVIVVTAPFGAAIGDIIPEATLDPEDVASYGAGSVEELLDALSPQTGSARGRGGGRPIVLLNGQRVSGFRELRDLPPEAIARVEIFPEELALRYGFRPDQRVVNLVLADNFAALTAEAEHGGSTQGGHSASEIEATLTRIDAGGRLNLDVEYARASSLTEAERGVIQPEGAPAAEAASRTLIPASDRIEANASYNRRLSAAIAATLSGEYRYEDAHALLGLAQSGPLARDTATRAGELGLTLNGRTSGWQWSATANYSRAAVTTRTDLEGEGREFARGVSQGADANATAAGSPFALPAGPLALSLSAGLEWRAIDSRVESADLVRTASLDRTQANARVTLDLPIASRRNDVLAAIGDLSLNATLGYRRLSDFGGLTEYGYGLQWEPFEGLSLLASVIGEEAAPTLEQLGDPVIVTPGVVVFDFTRGVSVAVDRTTGGNPALPAEARRDFKLTANIAPGGSDDLRFVAEYIRNRSENVAAAFPLLTPEIEGAFPDRVTRDPAGDLVAIDARPVSFAETRAERIRYGVNLSGRIGGGRGE
ncbi:MAG: hypothetical protein H7X93_00335, partial [Sphingomonadaceae bacterium]|nr:hypothetical protein [Sphingomonadaceae bacterium]